MSSYITITKEVRDLMIAVENMDPRGFQERPDGRLNMYCDDKLRKQLDTLAIKTGKSYNDALKLIYESAINE